MGTRVSIPWGPSAEPLKDQAGRGWGWGWSVCPWTLPPFGCPGEGGGDVKSLTLLGCICLQWSQPPWDQITRGACGEICLQQLQVSLGGPRSSGMEHQQHLSALQPQDKRRGVGNRQNKIVWGQRELDVRLPACDEMLSPPLGFDLCLLFFSCRLCIHHG